MLVCKKPTQTWRTITQNRTQTQSYCCESNAEASSLPAVKRHFKIKIHKFSHQTFFTSEIYLPVHFQKNISHQPGILVLAFIRFISVHKLHTLCVIYCCHQSPQYSYHNFKMMQTRTQNTNLTSTL